MSAINIIRQNDSVHLVTDGAVYDDEGCLISTKPKVSVLPHLSAAVGACGTTLGFLILTEMLAGADDYPDLKRTAADRFREAVDDIPKLPFITGLDTDMQMYVAGWSDDGPDAFAISSIAQPGVEPWTILPVDEIAICPGDAVADVGTAEFFGGRDVDELDPRVDGLKILEAQREKKVRRPSGRIAHIVGGFGQLTTVRRDEISTEILCRWPDKIGEKIRPRSAIKQRSIGDLVDNFQSS